MSKKLRSILFWIFYVLLTVVKLFTGVVVGLGDPTNSLVVKVYPTIKNFWSMGEETAVISHDIKGHGTSRKGIGY